VAVTLRQRLAALTLTVLVSGTATLFGGAAPAAASAASVVRPAYAPDGLCSTEEWRNPSNFDDCTNRLTDVTQQRAQCLTAPTPSAPDSGMAGWFASRPASSREPGPQGIYSDYGYAGYNYTTYDIGCVPTVMHPDYKFENTVANGELLVASSVIGASNALREKAWDPKSMWGWADSLVSTATKSVYDKVFTVFGTITLAVVGLYLLWRSRQSDMSAAMTTAGWAILVMVAVTAIARWPTEAANAADQTLTGSLNVVHSAVGPPAQDTPPDQCPQRTPGACIDHRPPAVRASDTAVEGMLYRNWLRGALGSADSETAKKYGPVLYDAKSLTWDEVERMRPRDNTPDAVAAAGIQRTQILERKRQQWMKVAEQIKAEDPEAYQYLQGTQGMERIGAGAIAILSSVFYALFDIVTSVLILLGFLIFRWAVVAAPLLGTIGLLRPANGGIRRIANTVVAAIFNIVIFGSGAAIYLYAVDRIMTTSLPGWLQVVLILLTGVVGWMLLRPYRRITQLGGRDPAGGAMQRVFLRNERQKAAERAAEKAQDRQAEADSRAQRPEARSEQPVVTATSPEQRRAEQRRAESAPAPRSSGEWAEPDVPDDSPSYTIYRPDSGEVTAPAPRSRRPESAPTRG